LQVELKEVKNERRALRGVCERVRNPCFCSIPPRQLTRTILQYRESSAGRAAQPDEDSLRRIDELENERDRYVSFRFLDRRFFIPRCTRLTSSSPHPYRLAHLLHLADTSHAALTAQLSETHTSIDVLSSRVRRKLEEQKHKLEAAYGEIEELRRECEGWMGRCAGLEREVEELERVLKGYEGAVRRG
jgi:DNA repair exonuclease SbcCD ATPase subunit